MIEVCSNARARAILRGQDTDVVFYPLERRLELSGGGAATASRTEGVGAPEAGGFSPSPQAAPGSGTSAVLPEDVHIEMLDINLLEYGRSDQARVRFFPNGTSDEMTLVLRSDKGEWRKIWLEVVTGLADWESDPQKFEQ